MNCDSCHDHILDYLYGELDEEQRQRFEEALTRCPQCAQDVRELQHLHQQMDASSLFLLKDSQRSAVLSAAKAHLTTAAPPAPTRSVFWLFTQPGFQVAAAAVFCVGIASWLLITTLRPDVTATDLQPYETAALHADDRETDAEEASSKIARAETIAESLESSESAAAIDDASAPFADVAEGTEEAAAVAISRAEIDTTPEPRSTPPSSRARTAPPAAPSHDEDAPQAIARASEAIAPAPTRMERAAPQASVRSSEGSAGMRAGAAPLRIADATDAERSSDEIARRMARSAPAVAAPDQSSMPSSLEGRSIGAAPEAMRVMATEEPSPTSPLQAANQAWEAKKYDEAFQLFNAVEASSPASFNTAETLYRALHTAVQTGERAHQERWADRYLERFPAGPHIDQVHRWREALPAP